MITPPLFLLPKRGQDPTEASLLMVQQNKLVIVGV